MTVEEHMGVMCWRSPWGWQQKVDRFARSKPWVLLASSGLALAFGTALLVSADADRGMVEFSPVPPDSGIGGGTGDPDSPTPTKPGESDREPVSNGFTDSPGAFSSDSPSNDDGQSSGSGTGSKVTTGTQGSDTTGSNTEGVDTDTDTNGFISINGSSNGRFNVSIDTDNMAPGDVRVGKINLKNTSRKSVVVSMSKSSLEDFGVSLKDGNNVEFTSKVLPAGDNEVVTLAISLPVEMKTKAANQVLTISFRAESNNGVN